MEPEVHIIEKYFQEILQCFTMTNVRCRRSKEIDLLAINPRSGEKYHVEVRIGTSPSFKIREKDTYTSKGRPHKIGLDYFQKEKFNHPIVIEKTEEIFGDSNYVKVLVVWDIEDMYLLRVSQLEYGFDIWRIGDVISDLVKLERRGSRDDIIRTLELVSILERHRAKRVKATEPKILPQLPYKSFKDKITIKCEKCGFRNKLIVPIEYTLTEEYEKAEYVPTFIMPKDFKCENCGNIISIPSKNESSKEKELKGNLKMKCPSCDHWNKVNVYKIFIRQPSPQLKVKIMIPMYAPIQVSKCEKCGKVIAEPKELIRIVGTK